MKAIVIAAMLLQTAPSSVVAPLTPSGKWTIEYDDAACILSRDFGTGKQLTTVGFNPSPFGGDIELVTIRSGSTAVNYRKTKGKLILQPSNQTIDSDIETYSMRTRGKILSTLRAERDVVAAMQTSTSIAIEFADGLRQEFAVPAMKSGFGALRTCQADLLKTWGIDPTESDRMKSPPEGISPAEWLTNDDYPANALSANQEGTSVMIWTVGLDGKIVGCRIVKSSGAKDLDDAACRGMTMRARYKPAIGLDDKPMLAHQMRKVVWQIPR